MALELVLAIVGIKDTGLSGWAILALAIYPAGAAGLACSVYVGAWVLRGSR